ncbi:MAG: helix-turn-helix transcriptional regulator [Piscinibacter sp.]|uniref:helix-turn-helix transcriptional regulator n=1 Tax=Piscinibacter sp. TaxID=1903157 RepID=UPI002583B92E|nr:substrate-binding domain-containing protein [Piscinibacter sp.]MCW5662500.1 helix-turn-helix transcriptional regulator [Piscinibacter sp.]
MHIRLHPHWEIGAEDGPYLPTADLLQLLAALQDSGTLAQAARSLGWSYRHCWGLVKRAEEEFGAPLITAGRGRGSALTELARRLIWADRRIAARLAPLLESLASEVGHELDRERAPARRAVRIDASHGFAVARLMEQLQAARIPVELRYRNSLESVAALARGDCDLAGFHVPIGEFEPRALKRYLRWLRADQHVLVHLAVRTQGLFVPADNPKGIRGIADLARPDVRFVNRPEGSGTRLLTELLLERAGIAPERVRGFDDTEMTHAAVAAYIASGMADVGLGVQTAAQRFGLHFIPLLRERYFFALADNGLAQPPVQRLLALLASPSCRAAIASLAGYHAAETGRVQRLDEAFDALPPG